MGKTRLLAELADRTGAAGATVLHGWCDPELDLPYQPIVELLRLWASNVALDDLRTAVGSHGAELARLVPDLAARLDLDAEWAAGGGVGNGDAARYRLFDGFWNVLAGIAAGTPELLVIVDDLQWADFGSCQLLRYVAKRGLPPSVHLVVAGRDDAGAGRPGVRLLDDIGAGLVGRRERVTPLDEAETVTLVRRLAPESWGPVNWALGRRIHRLTGGLPLAIRAVVHASPVAAPADELADAALELQVALTRRLSLLPAPTRELLRLAAIYGPTFDASELAELAEQSIDDVVEGLEPARAAGSSPICPPSPTSTVSTTSWTGARWSERSPRAAGPASRLDWPTRPKRGARRWSRSPGAG